MWIKFQTFIFAFTIASVFGGSKYYDGDNIPYEFGFKIEGNQHRQESKDANGIITGEFGFLTADGVYHQTVYGTDEDGNYRIISRKNFKLVSAVPVASPAKRESHPEKQLPEKPTTNKTPITTPSNNNFNADSLLSGDLVTEVSKSNVEGTTIKQKPSDAPSTVQSSTTTTTVKKEVTTAVPIISTNPPTVPTTTTSTTRKAHAFSIPDILIPPPRETIRLKFPHYNDYVNYKETIPTIKPTTTVSVEKELENNNDNSDILVGQLLSQNKVRIEDEPVILKIKLPTEISNAIDKDTETLVLPIFKLTDNSITFTDKPEVDKITPRPVESSTESLKRKYSDSTSIPIARRKTTIQQSSVKTISPTVFTTSTPKPNDPSTEAVTRTTKLVVTNKPDEVTQKISTTVPVSEKTPEKVKLNDEDEEEINVEPIEILKIQPKEKSEVKQKETIENEYIDQKERLSVKPKEKPKVEQKEKLPIQQEEKLPVKQKEKPKTEEKEHLKVEPKEKLPVQQEEQLSEKFEIELVEKLEEELKEKFEELVTSITPEPTKRPKEQLTSSPIVKDVQPPAPRSASLERSPQVSEESQPKSTTTAEPEIISEPPRPKAFIRSIDLTPVRVAKIENSALYDADMLYKFNYTAGFHGHNEHGNREGMKKGGYFIIGRDNIIRTVTYTASKNGFIPSIRFERVSAGQAPQKETEKDAGMKGIEFNWFMEPPKSKNSV